MAFSLAHKGIDVIVTYFGVNKDEADQVVAEIKALGGNAAALPLDVSKVKQLDDFFNR
jgi:NAD(P)-dependent dehydrogenase (short-subunit alcohol dehydrogenase family)